MNFSLTNIDFIDIHSHKKLSDLNELIVQNIHAYELDDFYFQTSKFYSIGIHPWFINEHNANRELQKIEFLAGNNNHIIAIGEAGIDRVNSVELDLQKDIFIKQVEISESIKKPMIIHCVRAYMDILEIRKKMKVTMPWIFHAYSENLNIAQKLVNENCYLSIGSRILNDTGKLSEVLENIDINYIFAETDEFEGKISKIYQKIAEIKKMSIVNLQNQLKMNFNSVFK